MVCSHGGFYFESLVWKTLQRVCYSSPWDSTPTCMNVLCKKPCNFSKHDKFSPKLADLSHGGTREAYHRGGPQYLGDPKRTSVKVLQSQISSFSPSPSLSFLERKIKINYSLSFNIFFILFIISKGKHSQAKKKENNYNLKSKRMAYIEMAYRGENCPHPTCAWRSCSHEVGSW